jgi:hypothetical protein
MRVDKKTPMQHVHRDVINDNFFFKSATKLKKNFTL